MLLLKQISWRNKGNTVVNSIKSVVSKDVEESLQLKDIEKEHVLRVEDSLYAHILDNKH